MLPSPSGRIKGGGALGETGGGRATHLKLDDPFLGKAQVHALRVLQVEGTLVELGDGVVGIQQRRLLVHLTDDLNKNRERGGYKLTGGSALLNTPVV